MDITRDSIHNCCVVVGTEDLGIVVWYFKARKIKEVVNKFETVKKQKKSVRRRNRRNGSKRNLKRKMSRRENAAAPLSFPDDNGLTIVRLSATDSAPNSRVEVVAWNALQTV